MKLKSPFAISSRLAPAVQIGAAWLSFDNGQFVLDLPDGSEYVERNLRGPACRIKGVNDTPESYLQDLFAAMLSFLLACAESRAYGLRQYGDAMKGENSDLFPENVGEWAESMSDEIGLLAYELEENRGFFMLLKIYDTSESLSLKGKERACNVGTDENITQTASRATPRGKRNG